jgi:hypothetical protein
MRKLLVKENENMFSKSHLKVLSSFFVNLAATWFIGLFLTKDIFVLTTNFLFSILSLKLSFVIEEELENYD